NDNVVEPIPVRHNHPAVVQGSVGHSEMVPVAAPLTDDVGVPIADTGAVLSKPQNVMNSPEDRPVAVIVTRVLEPTVVNKTVPQEPGALAAVQRRQSPDYTRDCRLGFKWVATPHRPRPA